MSLGGSEVSVTTLLLIVALVLGIVAVIRSRGLDLAGWGVILLAIVGLGVTG